MELLAVVLCSITRLVLVAALAAVALHAVVVPADARFEPITDGKWSAG